MFHKNHYHQVYEYLGKELSSLCIWHFFDIKSGVEYYHLHYFGKDSTHIGLVF